MFSGGPVARAGSCGNASTLLLLQPCPLPSYTCVLPLLSLARNTTLVHAVSSACAQLAAGLAFLLMGDLCNYCCSSRSKFQFFWPVCAPGVVRVFSASKRRQAMSRPANVPRLALLTPPSSPHCYSFSFSF